MTSKTLAITSGVSVVPDVYQWANPYGGAWGSAGNWTDLTTGSVAATAPGLSNAATITGGIAGAFTNITGSGAAGQLAINADVLLWGTIAVGGATAVMGSADLDLDGGATLMAGTLALGNGAALEVGGGSNLAAAGGAMLAGGVLEALNGSSIQLGGLVATGVNNGYVCTTGLIAVDGNSAIEVGNAGGAALGAITIDTGVTAAATGALDGNVVVKGGLAVEAGASLAIDLADAFGSATAIGGVGTLTISENSLLTLGIADSAAIAFGGPYGTLVLDALPSGAIAGFTSGDVIELAAPGGTAVATGLSIAQTGGNTAILTLVKGATLAGTLALAGNYAGSLFHLNTDAKGDGFISMQTIGSAPAQPSRIVGTAGYDVLAATAANQIITGQGGNDLLGAAGFTGVVFRDTSGDLNGSTIKAFVGSDVIDLTDISPNTATYLYTPGVSSIGTLAVTDGTHSATVGFAFSNGLQAGFFSAGPDASSGTNLTYTVANTDQFSFAASPGGSYATTSLWQDITTGAVASVAPSYGNAISINGTAGAYADVSGSGFAASLTTGGCVLLLGTLIAGSKLSGVSGNLTQTGKLALDGGASLVLAGSISAAGAIEVGGGSSLAATGGIMFANGATLEALARSSVRVASLLGSSGVTNASAIAVDTTSSIAIGATGTAAAGALTIESGVTAGLAGTVNGNVVVNGTLMVAGTLAVAPFGGVQPSVSGTGTIELTYGSSFSVVGPESAAILFSQTGAGGFAGTTETLTLGATMPAGVITGFGKGDVIVVGLVVTNLSYTQIGSSGRLTLLNGGTTVGVLLLSGNYSAVQFQVQLAPGGGSSLITYAPTPSAAVGGSVSGTPDAYSWTNIAGGIWGNAGNWTDTSTGSMPAAAPGASNAVTISDNTGAYTPQIIFGPGAAASLTVSSAADTILIGVITVTGLFTVNDYGSPSGQVALYGNTNLSAGSMTVSSLLRITSASLLTVLGTTGAAFISGSVSLGSGSVLRVDSGSSIISGSVAVDNSSAVEFGTAGFATSGALAVDSGQTVTLQGNANVAANVMVYGTLLVYGATIQGFNGSAATVTGTGTIVIGALGSSGRLVLNATDTAAIVFQLYSTGSGPYAFETLELTSPLAIGSISGFIQGDTIVIDRNVTGATFSQTTSSQGVLTLTNGSATVDTLRLQGSYTADLFQVDIAPATGVATITLQTATRAALAVTGAGNDTDSWTGASGGTWGNAGNWHDTTTAAVATNAPTSGNTVVIPGAIAAGLYTTIGGNGATTDLTVTGNVLLTGQVAVAGSVHVSTGNGPAAVLAFESGAQLTSGGSAQVFGRLEFGGGSIATITGYALMYGGSLLALNNSVVQSGGLIGDSAGDVIAVDASSSLNIGTSSGLAGTLTISASAPAQFAGIIYASVVNNGRLWVSGAGTLLIDMSGTAAMDPYGSNPTISGSGLLTLAEGSTLGLGVACSAGIQFMGPNATLALAAIPTGAIYNFAAGDQIQVDQTVTGIAYQQVNGSVGTLTLSDGAATVGQLVLAGAYGNGVNVFHLDAAPAGNTATITLQSLQTNPAQMSFIAGTFGSDQLTATANGQTITGYGGSDILSAGVCSGVDFRDYSFYLSGSAIQNFSTTDMVDFIDINPATASASYANSVLSVSDGIHSSSLSLTFASTPASGSFHATTDGSGGTKLTWY